MPEWEQCRELIHSENYAEELVGYYGQENLLAGETCYQLVNEDFAVVYHPIGQSTEESLRQVSFFTPYCYGLLQQENLEDIGVSRVRRISGFDYRGSGILIGFVDTGIDYSHPVFLQADGSSRVKVIWDQGSESGTPPEGFFYGTEFGEEAISLGEAPKDENGHGTFLAGVAAGREVLEENFAGVASLAELAVVKLRGAKQYLKEYFCMPETATAYSEADIMLGIRFLLEYAAKRSRPLVLCLGLGCSLGSHRGTTPLALYLNSLAYRPDVCLVTAAGNEGNTRHHESLLAGEEQRQVELYVEQRSSGFTLELFAEAIADLSMRMISPAGESSGLLGGGFSGTMRIPYLFDRSVLYVEKESLMRTGTMQRFRFRFQTPSAGIWRLQLEQSKMPYEVRMWLPMNEFLEGDVYFLASEPEVTLCEPSNAPLLLVVGGYSVNNGGLAPFSGRGFTADGQNQPSVLAPAVNVTGPFAGGGYITRSGTSIGAAYTAGCAALFLEYIEEYRESGRSVPMDTVLLRTLFSLGAVREEDVEYPNPAYGFGKLNLYGVFEFLRSL